MVKFCSKRVSFISKSLSRAQLFKNNLASRAIKETVLKQLNRKKTLIDKYQQGTNKNRYIVLKNILEHISEYLYKTSLMLFVANKYCQALKTLPTPILNRL